MQLSVRGMLPAAAVGLAMLLGGCGGGSTQSVPKHPFAYDARRPLLAQVVQTARDGPVDVRSLSYVTFDGTRVPALFAIPSRHQVLGCLIFQPGVGAPKETAAPLWPGAAKLGLAVFTIDPRYTGARAGIVTESQVLSNPDLVAGFFRDDVIDLRRGLDYLESQPMCRHNVGYLGVSEGGILGTLLSGTDSRIRAAVVASVGATFRARLFYSPYILPGIVRNAQQFHAALHELSPLDPARWIDKISPRPVMIIDGLNDPAIPIIDALDLAAAAHQPKVLLLHRGGHNPFAGPQASQVDRQIAAFLTAHLVRHPPS
jgi:cephalosporin-C deacetylase-like acetyl esterase